MRSYPLKGTTVMVSVPHPYPAQIHALRSGPALASVGSAHHGNLGRGGQPSGKSNGKSG
jgi:hypothetical protein